MLKTILLIAQIALPGLLIVSVLLQQRGAALGSAFGGGGDFYLTRRGAEKQLFYATIVLATLFILVSIVNLTL